MHLRGARSNFAQRVLMVLSVAIMIIQINCLDTIRPESSNHDSLENFFEKALIKQIGRDAKHSNSTEYQNRRTIFYENVERVRRLNKAEKGTAVFVISEKSIFTSEELGHYMGDNYLATNETIIDFSSSLKHFNTTWKRILGESGFSNEEKLIKSMPEEFDWRLTGSISRVKNQKPVSPIMFMSLH